MVASPPRLPIMLVHGLGGFDELRIELIRRHPLVIVYFRGIAERLRAEGAAETHTALLPRANSIELRAAALRDCIEQRVPRGKVHILAHSMGGLDARHYITRQGGADRVCSLTTIGSPHHGSALANLTTESLLEPALSVARRARLDKLLGELQRASLAHHDLRPDACARFNASTPDAPGVQYFSWAGAPPRVAIQGLLKLPALVLSRLEAGPNDGLVSVDSARWSGWRGTIPADHFSMIGWQWSRVAKNHFDPEAFYVSLLEDLKAAES